MVAALSLSIDVSTLLTVSRSYTRLYVGGSRSRVGSSSLPTKSYLDFVDCLSGLHTKFMWAENHYIKKFLSPSCLILVLCAHHTQALAVWKRGRVCSKDVLEGSGKEGLKG